MGGYSSPPPWAAKRDPGVGRLERDLPVAQCFDSVCPMGHPMSHSTHSGLSAPPTSSLSGRLFCFVALLPDFQSRASGVGHVRALTASISVPPSRLFLGVIRPPLLAKDAVGVGHIDAQVASPSTLLALAPLRL